MTAREKIVQRIRALLQMTVRNGCTEAEATSAATIAHKLMTEHAITEDEASVEQDDYSGNKITILDDMIGERIWKVADSIAKLATCRYWTNKDGEYPKTISFFGEVHFVKIAKYLLAICFRAMQAGRATIETKFALQPRKVRPNLMSYLDGMADRLYERIKAMVPKADGLVLLKLDMIDHHVRKAGHVLGRQDSARTSREFDSYQDGRAHADRVNLHAGLSPHEQKRIT